MINRRNFQILAAGLVLGAGELAPRAQADSKTFRIALAERGRQSHLPERARHT
jgi:hypothetical protein